MYSPLLSSDLDLDVEQNIGFMLSAMSALASKVCLQTAFYASPEGFSDNLCCP